MRQQLQTPASARAAFQRAEWRHLALLSRSIDPARLGASLPAGAELDLRDGQALVSVVAFLAEGSPVTVCRGRRIAP